MLRITSLLGRLREKNASDLHLRAGAKPLVRINGTLAYEEDIEVLTTDTILDLFAQITTEPQRETFANELELDFSYAAAGVGRFRFSAYVQRGSISLACRPVQTMIPTIDELGLPPICKKLAMKDDGLILICGPTGCGKSTTLAAMIEYMNSNIKRNIITIEDPIEYIHNDKLCSFSQRQVGTDTRSFNNALKHALRQDPDVILMGEMRDLDSIATTLTAAETGHLVLTTLHAPNAILAIDRIIDVFPPHQQEQIRLQLASTMRGILFQMLIPRRDDQGRIAAVEVMLKTEAISNLIRQKKNHQITSIIQSAADEGMQTLDEAILRLYRAGQISRDHTLACCTDQAEMIQRLLSITERAVNHDRPANHDRVRINV
jgi:twitching motility protein PilT